MTAGVDASDESDAVRRTPLFIVTCLAAGAGAAVGSVLGHYFGALGLRVVALLGGVAGVVVATRLAHARCWIPARLRRSVTIGGSVGFLAAVAVALETMSSPVGPLLSSLLVGVGALAGARLATRATRATPPGPLDD
jgi:hypothetical protein